MLGVIVLSEVTLVPHYVYPVSSQCVRVIFNNRLDLNSVPPLTSFSLIYTGTASTEVSESATELTLYETAVDLTFPSILNEKSYVAYDAEIGGNALRTSDGTIAASFRVPYGLVHKEGNEDDIEKDLFDKLNAIRKSKNIPELKQTDQLKTLARIFADDLAITAGGAQDGKITTWGDFGAFLDTFGFTTNGGSVALNWGSVDVDDILQNWKDSADQNEKIINPDYRHGAAGINLNSQRLAFLYARLSSQALLRIIDTDQMPQGAYQFFIRWNDFDGIPEEQMYLTDDEGYVDTQLMDYGNYSVYDTNGSLIGYIQIDHDSSSKVQTLRIEKISGMTFSVFVCERLTFPDENGSIVGPAIVGINVSFYPVDSTSAVCELQTGKSGIASCHGDNFQTEEQLLIVIKDKNNIYETFSNRLQFYDGKSRLTVPLGRQYTIYLYVNVGAGDTCPPSTEVRVYARRGTSQVLLFRDVDQKCSFVFQNRNEEDKLQINEMITVSAYASGYRSVDVSQRISDVTSSLHIELEPEESENPEEEEPAIPEELPTPPQVVEEEQQTHSKTPIWLIVVLCIACALALAVCGILLYCCCKKPKSENQKANSKTKKGERKNGHEKLQSAQGQSQISPLKDVSQELGALEDPQKTGASKVLGLTGSVQTPANKSFKEGSNQQSDWAESQTQKNAKANTGSSGKKTKKKVVKKIKQLKI